MVDLFANSGDPEQTPRSVATDLEMHCLPINLLEQKCEKYQICLSESFQVLEYNFLFIWIVVFS